MQYDITGSGGVYLVDGVADPVALPPGDTIGMTIDSGHPLRLDVNPSNGCTETVTWTSDGGSVVSTDFHTGDPRAAVRPRVLPAQHGCSNHGPMQGADRFVAAASPPSAPPAPPPAGLGRGPVVGLVVLGLVGLGSIAYCIWLGSPDTPGRRRGP